MLIRSFGEISVKCQDFRYPWIPKFQDPIVLALFPVLDNRVNGGTTPGRVPSLVFCSLCIVLVLPQRTFIPYVSGVGWSKILPASDLPLKPLISVCKLSLRADINVHQGEQMAARFWTASLEYIRSIPDCTAFDWTPTSMLNRSRLGPL